MRAFTRLRLILTALALPAPVGAQESVPAAALLPFEARQAMPGIHVLSTPDSYRGPAIGNITIVEQSDGIVMVDSGGTAADGRRAAAFVRSITKKPVKAVILTHWHNDHPLGVSAIRDAWPRVRIIATAATQRGLLGPTAEYVGLKPDEHYDTMTLNQLSEVIAQAAPQARNPANDEALRKRYATLVADMEKRKADLKGTYLVPPTETFARELLIDDPLRPVKVMFLGRANTDGDAITWLPRDRVVVTGDVVVAPAPFGYFSYPGDWIGVLEKLKALDYRLLIPGHGEPQTDIAYLERLIGTLKDVRAQVGPLARQGLSLEEVRKRVDYSEQTRIFGTTPRIKSGFEGNWLIPITESAWKEARGEPIVQGKGETPADVRRRHATSGRARSR